MDQFAGAFKVLPEDTTISGAAISYFSAKKFGTNNSFRRYMKVNFGIDYEYHTVGSILQNLVAKDFLSKPPRHRKGLYVLCDYLPTEEARLGRRDLIVEAGRRYRMKKLNYGEEPEEEPEDGHDEKGTPIPLGEKEDTRSLYEVLKEIDEASGYES